jgi:hypothetical protein
MTPSGYRFSKLAMMLAECSARTVQIQTFEGNVIKFPGARPRSCFTRSFLHQMHDRVAAQIEPIAVRFERRPGPLREAQQFNIEEPRGFDIDAADIYVL